MKIHNKSQKNVTTNNAKSTVKDNKENLSTQLPSQERNIFPTIDENFAFINCVFGDGIGLIKSKYSILDNKFQVGIVYIDNFTDNKFVSSQIVEPLLKANFDFKLSNDEIIMILQSRIIYAPDVQKSNQMRHVINSLLTGSTVLFIDGIENSLIIQSRKVENRPIEKPINEATVLGSMDSLTEDINTNCNLINKRLPVSNLRFENFTVGLLSNTKVKLLWIEGVANIKMIEEVRTRIQKINIDVVEGIGVLSELIQDSPMSIFTTYKQTQRPDLIVKSLSDGQFVILCDNSPFAFIAPISFWDHFKTMDDYAEKTFAASYLRITRYIAFILATTTSPLYLAFVTYNHSIVPAALGLNIASSREGVPFPSIFEVLFMSLGITIIREASLRISGPIGYFIGTLSAIVIGQASVSAGYVSASVIIVVAISTISSYSIASNTLVYPSRIINYFLIFLSGIFGMFGIINGFVIILWHMVSLESFGVPYLYPMIPFDFEGLKDTFIRAPLSTINKRLRILAPSNTLKVNDEDKKKH